MTELACHHHMWSHNAPHPLLFLPKLHVMMSTEQGLYYHYGCWTYLAI